MKMYPIVKGHFLWVMLNPSTADASKDDPTMRRVIYFTQRFNGTSLSVVNLFDYRTTVSAGLASATVALQSEFWRSYVVQAIETCDTLVFAWGSAAPKAIHHQTIDAQREVIAIATIAKKQTSCLAINGNGAPAHPLYQPKTAKIQSFEC